MRESLSRTKLIVGALSVAAAGMLTAVVARHAGNGVRAKIPAGTRLVAELSQTISTSQSEPGQPVQLRTVQPLALTDGVTIPEGLVIQGEVAHTRGGGRVAGAPDLVVRFTGLVVQGHHHEISADDLRVRGSSDLGGRVALVGAGAAVGGVVGALAGNTAVGVVTGAVIGTGTAVATKDDHIVLPAGQKVRVRMARPVTVKFTPARDGNPES